MFHNTGLGADMNPTVDQKLTSFFNNYKTLKAKKGELLCRPGESFNQLIFVKAGLLRQYVISKLGAELSINTVSPDYPFSFVHLLTGSKNKYFLEAMTGVEYLKVPKQEFQDFVSLNQDVFVELSKRVASHLEELLTNIEFYITGDAYMKVASVMYLIARRYGKTNGDGQLEVESMPTHKNISELIGLTRETVSLQILKLEKDGVIKRKGRRLIIPNLKKIEEASAFVAG